MKNSKLSKSIFVVVTILITGCSSFDWIATSGPSSRQVLQTSKVNSLIRVIDVTNDVTRQVIKANSHQLFSEEFPNYRPFSYVVGLGDVLEVSVWEALPATLFGMPITETRQGLSSSRAATFSELMVSASGKIDIPFADAVPVLGRTPQQIQADIAHRLAGKANQPQVLVRVTRNSSANVTVVGEVTQSIRMPLTASGERLLDAIAAAGGVRQPVNKVTIQLTRGDVVKSLPLDDVIQSPQENVTLKPGDIVTAQSLPLSFSVLGAIGKNDEINFEAQGISLAQALARAGGFNDSRADARGVFVFRFEDPKAVASTFKSGPTTPDGKVPVVYRMDMKDPTSFLIAQNFPIRNKDVLYVSNAPSAELQKFLTILYTTVYSATGISTMSN